MECVMLVRVLAIGTKMPDWVVSGVDEYQRRLSSDIRLEIEEIPLPKRRGETQALVAAEAEAIQKRLDRKSTRLNSSHVRISYAVFCLKKKKTQNKLTLLSHGSFR